MSALQSLASGLVVGISVAAPIGPMGMLCIQRTLAYGIGAGLATGLGAATVHFALGTIGVMGIEDLLQGWIRANATLMGMASVAILLWFAVGAYRRPVVVGVVSGGQEIDLLRAYVSAMGLGLFNPLTLPLLLAGLGTADDVVGAGWWPVLGIFSGSVAWWTLLSTAVSVARWRVDGRLLSFTNKIASAGLIGLGAWTLLRTMQVFGA